MSTQETTNGTSHGSHESESEHFSPYRSDGKLYGFVCVVIGATDPIGQAITHELAAHGAACIYACTLPNATPASPNKSPSPNTKLIPYPYHPTEETTLQLIDDVLNTHGRLDIWITVAPPSRPTTLSGTTPDTLSSLFETTALVPFYALKYAPPAMQKLCPRGVYPNAAPKDTPYGSVVVVGGLAASHGGWSGVGETMVGHAAGGLVKAGVKELRGTAVRVNGISYGAVGEGAKGRVERVGTAEEVARVAGFLASGFSSYVNGAMMVVDGGASAMGVGVEK